MASIIFTSGSRNTKNTGFELTYRFQDSGNRCGENLVSGFGNIKSPGYPNNYESNTFCTWKINLWEGDHIALDFLDIDLEEGKNGNCDFDFITVFSLVEFILNE